MVDEVVFWVGGCEYCEVDVFYEFGDVGEGFGFGDFCYVVMMLCVDVLGMGVDIVYCVCFFGVVCCLLYVLWDVGIMIEEMLLVVLSDEINYVLDEVGVFIDCWFVMWMLWIVLFFGEDGIDCFDFKIVFVVLVEMCDVFCLFVFFCGVFKVIVFGFVCICFDDFFFW